MASASVESDPSWCPCDTVCSLVSETPLCSSSSMECAAHSHFPEAIMSKIDWTEALAGSVKTHSMHILIAHGSDAGRWPEEVTSVRDGYAAALDTALSDAKAILPIKVRSSLSDACTLDAHGQPLGSLVEEEAHPEVEADLLIFPDMIRVHRVRKDQLTQFVNALAEYANKLIEASKPNAAAANIPAPTATADAASSTDSSAAAASSSSSSSSSSASAASTCAASTSISFPLPHSVLEGAYFLICSHKLRDKRCGVSGPLLVAEFDRLISESYPSTPTPHPVHTVKISHIGGHKFAGNVIAYPAGNWYGRVLPCHVPHLLLAHAEGFEILDKSSGEPQRISAAAAGGVENQRKILQPLLRGAVTPIGGAKNKQGCSVA